MVQEKLVSQYTLKSNQPFLLHNPQELWLVISGQISVFATGVSNQQPTGERRYLFDVNPGEIFCGVAVTQNLGLLAVALEDVELQQLSWEDLQVQIAQENFHKITLLESWLQHLAEAISLESLQKNQNPDYTSLSPCSRDRIYRISIPYLLETNQTIKPPANQIIWLKVSQGTISWLNFSNLTLDQDSPWFPLVGDMWLTAISPTEIRYVPTFQCDDNEQLSASLEIFHRYFCYALNLHAQERQEVEFRRFQAREQLNKRLNSSALGKLV